MKNSLLKMLSIAYLLMLSVNAFSEVLPSQTTKFKKLVGNIYPKYDILVFQNAIDAASRNDLSQFDRIIDYDYSSYIALITANVNSGGTKVYTQGEIVYMLIHSKLVTRHHLKGEKVWGRLSHNSSDYYLAPYDFDSEVLVWEDATGLQTDLLIWECFNPKPGFTQMKQVEIQYQTQYKDTGSTKYVDVPGPTKYVDVPGPTVYESAPQQTYQPTYQEPYYPQSSGYGSSFQFGLQLGFAPQTCCQQQYYQPTCGSCYQQPYVAPIVQPVAQATNVQQTVEQNVNITNINNSSSTTNVDITIPGTPTTPGHTNTGGGGDPVVINGHNTGGGTGDYPTGTVVNDNTNNTGGGDRPDNTGGNGTNNNNTGGAGKTDETTGSSSRMASNTGEVKKAPVATQTLTSKGDYKVADVNGMGVTVHAKEKQETQAQNRVTSSDDKPYSSESNRTAQPAQLSNNDMARASNAAAQFERDHGYKPEHVTVTKDGVSAGGRATTDNLHVTNAEGISRQVPMNDLRNSNAIGQQASIARNNDQRSSSQFSQNAQPRQNQNAPEERASQQQKNQQPQSQRADQQQPPRQQFRQDAQTPQRSFDRQSGQQQERAFVQSSRQAPQQFQQPVRQQSFAPQVQRQAPMMPQPVRQAPQNFGGGGRKH
jgi:hypothetical protein